MMNRTNYEERAEREADLQNLRIARVMKRKYRALTYAATGLNGERAMARRRRQAQRNEPRCVSTPEVYGVGR